MSTDDKPVYSKPKLNSIAVIGNYLPRRCGIATFTTDLCEALAAELPGVDKVIAIAMNDIDEGYPYPDRVKFEVRDQDPSDYLRAAEFLNLSRTDVVILQHEYGIFGGPSGSNIFQLLNNLRMPILTTLHTVGLDPTQDQKSILSELGRISDRLIVMSRKSIEVLKDVYGVPEHKVTFIPHGIPDVPFTDPVSCKGRFELEGRKVLLTFGLLGKGKGIESVIKAMPHITEHHKDVLYVILGATHPHVIRTVGEGYRHNLQQLARDLAVDSNVRFYDQFLDLQSLAQFIRAADVYVTPYPSRNQIVSGTLSYALGAGAAVVSTPYLYAEEMLADGRGVLVPFDDPGAMGRAIVELLSDDAARNTMRKKAYQYCRSMVWKEVARTYVKTVRGTLPHNGAVPRSPAEISRTREPEALPTIKLDHLRVLTDDTGILQHAFFSMPDRDHGYCVDDNARALIVGCKYYRRTLDDTVVPLIKTYLAFLRHALNRKRGRYHNFLSYGRQWMDAAVDDDCHGRALWGLGVATAMAPDELTRARSVALFIESMGAVVEFTSPRGMAFALLGLHFYLNVHSGDTTARKLQQELTMKLLGLFQINRTDDWPWCEDMLTYANGRLPEALMLSGQDLGESEMVETGRKSLTWLLDIQTNERGQLSVIGNDGWMTRGGHRAHFDQQPLEVTALIDACAAAYRVTDDGEFVQEARRCLDWFFGRNELCLPLYDSKTGGCCDGLGQHGVNQNMGAESTLAGLMSLLTVHDLLGQEVRLKDQRDIVTETEA